MTDLDLLTLSETAEATRTPEATLRYWRHKGTGPRSFRIGRRVMYKREDVEAWVQTQYAQQHGGPVCGKRVSR